MVHLLGTVSLIAGAVTSTMFVALYWVSARWYRSAEGWHLMTFTGVIALVLLFTSYRTLTTAPRPMSAGIDIARLAIFGSVALLLVWRLWLLYRIQIRSSRRRP